MAAVVAQPMAIPGLGLPLERTHLVAAHTVYNGLGHIDDQPTRLTKTEKGHVKALLQFIIKNNMGEFFGIHLVHRHDPLHDDTVRLECDDPGIEGASWTRATPIKDVNLNDIHATTFKLVQGNLVPVEFAMGPSPSTVNTGVAQDILVAFLAKIASSLAEYDVGERLALEVKDFANRHARGLHSGAEIEVHWGNSSAAESFTVVLPFTVRACGFRKINPLTPTGWDALSYPKSPGDGPNDPDPDPDPEAPPAGVHYEPVVTGSKKGSHRVNTNSVGAPTADKVRLELANMGFIAVTGLEVR